MFCVPYLAILFKIDVGHDEEREAKDTAGQKMFFWGSVDIYRDNIEYGFGNFLQGVPFCCHCGS